MRRLAALVLTLGLGLAGAVVTPVPPAHAIDILTGFTWYSDGTYEKSGPAGTVITVYATQAKADTPFRLMAAPIREGYLPCFRPFNTTINPNVRLSSSTGLIGNTTGRLDVGPGNYQICFVEVLTEFHADTGTVPVYFTVL